MCYESDGAGSSSGPRDMVILLGYVNGRVTPGHRAEVQSGR